VDDQRRDVDLCDVSAEVGTPERGNAVQRPLRRSERGDLERVLPLRFADQIGLRTGTEEAGGESVEEYEPVTGDAGLEAGDRRIV